MKYAAILVATSAAIASAQFTINSTGTIICTGNPNGAFCAGDSLTTNIIIRCTNGIGQAGNCNDNTAGYFPFGNDGGSECWQTSNTTGDAACEKNCIVECGTGNCGESFTLPGCTPSATQSSSTASSTVTTSSTSSPVSTTSATTTPASNLTITSTGTSICTTGGTTTTITFTTTFCPESTLSTSTVAPTSVATSSPVPVSSTYILSTGTGTGSTSTAASNGTVTTTKSASATPVGPSSTTSATPSTYTGAAMRDSAGAGLAAIGLFIAYFL